MKRKIGRKKPNDKTLKTVKISPYLISFLMSVSNNQINDKSYDRCQDK